MYNKNNLDDKHKKKTAKLTIRLFLMRIYHLRYRRKYYILFLLFIFIILFYYIIKNMLYEQYETTLIIDNERHLFIRLFKENDLNRQKIRPFRILSGSLHYFRVLPQLWSDRIEQMKKAGLNTIETYIPWNFHEAEKGVYKFNEGLTDLVSFLKLIHQHEMFTIIRPSGKKTSKTSFFLN
jgi:hypothetical protein